MLGIDHKELPESTMSRPLKRARTSGVRVARPIDKELKITNQAVTNSVVSTTLKTTTFPGTVVGLRWSLSIGTTLTTASPVIAWAIVVIPDGEAANTPALSDGADFYTPEQNVLAFGLIRAMDFDSGASPQAYMVEGTTKTMRKLKQGDVLAVISLSDTASGGFLDGIVQFFFKT